MGGNRRRSCRRASVRRTTSFSRFINDPDHNRFNLLISLVATAQVILLAGRRGSCRANGEPVTRSCGGRSSVGGRPRQCSCFRFSFLLYRILPELRFVQLPLRWLLCLNVVFALLLTMAFRRWLLRILACVVMLVGAARGCGIGFSLRGGTTRPTLLEMQDNQLTGAGYEGADEYVPTGADAYEINKDARLVALREGE